MPESTSIGVVGAGTMGGGIAQVFAAKGYRVELCDAVTSQLERALSTIKKNLNRDLEKNRINETDRDRILTNIRPQADLKGLKQSALVIEAVSEVFDVKQRVFAELDRICEQTTILATNTSSISVTQLAGTTEAARPRDWHAFHEPGSGDEVGRDHSRHCKRQRRHFWQREVLWRSWIRSRWL